MNTTNNVKIAEEAFQKISSNFPSIQMKQDSLAPVELSIDIPIQQGVRYAVNLNLQNGDELHFSVGHFHLEWFPCTDPTIVELYVDAVSGYLAGRYRILEHYRWKICVRAELQIPAATGQWKTIGTYYRLWVPFPRKHFKELRNA